MGGGFGSAVALSLLHLHCERVCVLFRCVCSTVCIARHLCVWIVDHIAHAIILYLEHMCRFSLLELINNWIIILYNIPKHKR